MTPPYPADWPVIARAIRVDRANGRCECDGRCRPEDEVDWTKHPQYVEQVDHRRCVTRVGMGVQLNVVTLDFDTSNVDPENLMAMCPDCRIGYTAEHLALEHAERLAGRNAAGTGALPLDGLGIEL